MGKLGLVAFAALGLIAGTGCGESDDRPANHHFVSGGTGGGGGSGAGSGLGGAPCTPDPEKGVAISGNVITYDVLLAEVSPFAGTADLKAPGQTCAAVSTTWDGSATGSPDGGPPLFVLESVKQGAETQFVHLYPTGGEPVYPTLLAVIPAQDMQVLDYFGLVLRAGVDEVYAATGVARDPDKGTLIVQIVDKYDAPISGVEVDLGTAAAPAYPGLSGWQLGGQTDASGIAVMLNATSKPFPGQAWTVNIKLGTAKESFKGPAESGAVTILRIRPTVGFN